MNYRKNKLNGDELSLLGFGCMRFPKDEAETERLILHAIENGVNYFDTAYIYPGSEAALGRALSKHGRRGDVKIATKIPHYFVKKSEDLDKIFNKQLERLKTDYIDYYFIHMLTDVNVWKRLTDLGIKEWIDARKAEGAIRNIGFSYHGGREDFINLCGIYGWEFCMIQYNYMDENNLAGTSGLIHAAGAMPVMVMEPLKGGILVNNLPKDAINAFGTAHIKRSPAEWALRWVFSRPEVTCVLSGMSTMGMLEENIKAASASDAGEFTASDAEVISRVKQALVQTVRVPCTACSYCMPCPRNVDIPTSFFCYNDIAVSGRMRALSNYMSQTSLRSVPQTASLCNGCGKCETLCPQKIEIRRELKKTAEAFEPFYMKPVLYLAKKFMKLK